MVALETAPPQDKQPPPGLFLISEVTLYHTKSYTHAK